MYVLCVLHLKFALNFISFNVNKKVIKTTVTQAHKLSSIYMYGSMYHFLAHMCIVCFLCAILAQ